MIRFVAALPFLVVADVARTNGFTIVGGNLSPLNTRRGP